LNGGPNQHTTDELTALSTMSSTYKTYDRTDANKQPQPTAKLTGLSSPAGTTHKSVLTHSSKK